ncbi:MAG TPA: hypothetical protein ENH67_07155 [Pseudoalteromonas sp.]|uniref:Sel1 repeat family protein n=1 Tax=marine sediment metagenome TaxID=412755 RepID=A0A0F9USQ5_9ZZZZ|nr:MULTISPECIES: SEL1-like repeat protein [unclassified Pseudoalteromonas]MDN3384327.1 SEL1-like repeat protein [Pseudoalteromonas sp. APC 3358]HDY93532.1 hypothetical protein [Pseudoalteromonas sp.]HDZ32648.1 hypothetical protein [Pseudoalteromonas sp.]
MFGIFKKKVDLTDLSKITDKDLKILQKTKSGNEFGRIIREAAFAGSVDCQTFISMASLLHLDSYENKDYPQEVEETFTTFTTMAAENNDIGSQFNLAKFYLNKVDLSDGKLHQSDHKYLKQAEFWYEKAAQNGDLNSQKALEDCEELFRMAV